MNKKIMILVMIQMLMVCLCSARETTIYTDADAGNYIFISYMNFGNTNDLNLKDNREKKVFFHFDVSSLTGYTVDNVEMNIFVAWVEDQYNTSPNQFPVQVYRVDSPWNENYLAWQYRDNSVFWDCVNLPTNDPNYNRGGDYSTLISNQYNLSNTTGLKTVASGQELINLVQGWIDGTIPNYGIMVMRLSKDPGGSHQRTIARREAYEQSKHAQLSIVYHQGEKPDCDATWNTDNAMRGDLNKDCYVDFLDLNVFASEWLDSINE
ncbi:MAG: hypothetical protein A2Y12_20000 [Planctomycetes bacterium GWF2_42_9]|nr:MAG: hypothetical protein A2Y12_20000 [Planctomycetes bacterium GWF2_42_9]